MILKKIKAILIVMFCGCMSNTYADSPVNVTIDMLPQTDWTVNPLIFGSYSEEHWGDITPGVYEQYLINPSFEEWFYKSGENKTQLVWDEIPSTEGIAYPWEGKVYSGSPVFSLSDDRLNSKYSQQVTLKSAGQVGLYQRLALPDYRSGIHYNLTFYAKVTGDLELRVACMNLEDAILSNVQVTDLSSEWKEYKITVAPSRSSNRFINRYGVYKLFFLVRGTGQINIDQATLFPSDCIEGIYNPETLNYFKQYKIQMVRWPGGNFTSGYHWYDGIGPILDRPTQGNRAWGGLNANHVGTDEFLRFCELAGITPVMGVGFGEITTKEAAGWVEYCNGDVSTPMGALRAANGRTEPYNVKYWGVGNEVYGSYQIGNTNSEPYAKGLINMIEAMRKKDPDIMILASGYGVHNTFRVPNQWNKIVAEIVGDHIDLFDVHQYVYGPNKTQAASTTKEEMFRAYVASNFYLRGYINDLRKVLDYKDTRKDIKMALLEWGVLPSVSDNQPPLRQTFINMLCSSVQYNEMIRQGDLVQMAAFHNFSFYIAPVRAHAEPVNPRTSLFEHYTETAGGKLLNITSADMPTYAVTSNYEGIGKVAQVPELDILAVRKDNAVYVALVNRNIEEAFSLNLNFINGQIQDVAGYTYTSAAPFERILWNNSTVKPQKVITSVQSMSEGSAVVDVPKLSFSFLKITIK